MPDLLNVSYAQTGASTKHNALGMREMQARAYEKRNAQFLLLKAPPASGKSRALMFLALDKVYKQGMEKVIIAVPEMSIGGSFKDTNLTQYGFFADWHINPQYNLCTNESNFGKTERVQDFLSDKNEHFLLCTHSTLRFAYEKIQDIRILNKTVIAIDEFHHTSAEDGNKLGAMLDDIMQNSTAHIIAMTGSYFRGDQVPILTPEMESRFTQVTYTYYEQLNGYKYLKSLGLGYHFYQGKYFEALKEVLDTRKKTIIHIPNVNSRESSKDKYTEGDKILELIGTYEYKDPETGIMTVKTEDNRLLKIADLVTDGSERPLIQEYLRNIKNKDDMDIIIALGMAKEGFDWQYCEHVLTVGYRSSMTEVVQIIGRATRDCEGKEHAQFTNLIAQPDAQDEDVKTAVNNLIKAISPSLLMREVLAPSITFRPRSSMLDDEKAKEGEIIIEDRDKPVSEKTKTLLENGSIEQIIQSLITKPETIAPAIVDNKQGKVITEIELPKVIKQIFPDLNDEDFSTILDVVKTKLAISSLTYPDSTTAEDNPYILSSEPSGSRGILKLGNKFIDVDKLQVDLIDKINPFQGAYEILSKSIDAPLLKNIQDYVTAENSDVTVDEALLLWHDIQKFIKEYHRSPDLNSFDPYEKRLAEVFAFIRREKAKDLAKKQMI